MLYISSKPGANHERWWQRCLIAISRFPNHYGLLSTDRCLQLAGNDWQNSWPRWPPDGCKGSHPGSRLDRLGRAPGRDRLYDADAVTKELVRIARSALASHLRGRDALVGFLEWDVDTSKGIDDHLAALGPEMVLDEIGHMDFAGSAWKRDVLRSKPPMNTTEGRILPVLANAIAAFRHAPEWIGVLAFNEFGFGTVVLKPAPWGVVPKGEWTDHEDRLAAEWLQRQGIMVSFEVAGQAVQTPARDHQFHPVKAYLQGLRRDGVERLERWLSTYLGADDADYTRAVGSRGSYRAKIGHLSISFLGTEGRRPRPASLSYPYCLKLVKTFRFSRKSGPFQDVAAWKRSGPEPRASFSSGFPQT